MSSQAFVEEHPRSGFGDAWVCFFLGGVVLFVCFKLNHATHGW